MTSDKSTNLWVDAPGHDRASSLSPYRQYSTAPFSFSRPDEFSRLVSVGGTHGLAAMLRPKDARAKTDGDERNGHRHKSAKV